MAKVSARTSSKDNTEIPISKVYFSFPLIIYFASSEDDFREKLNMKLSFFGNSSSAKIRKPSKSRSSKTFHSLGSDSEIESV